MIGSGGVLDCPRALSTRGTTCCQCRAPARVCFSPPWPWCPGPAPANRLRRSCCPTPITRSTRAPPWRPGRSRSSCRPVRKVATCPIFPRSAPPISTARHCATTARRRTRKARLPTRPGWRRSWRSRGRHDFTAVFDECYSELYFDEAPPSVLEVAAERVVASWRTSSLSIRSRSAPARRVCAVALSPARQA